MVNALAIKQRLKFIGMPQQRLAAEIGISRSTFFLKINGMSEFTADELQKIAEILKLTDDEILRWFFYRTRR